MIRFFFVIIILFLTFNYIKKVNKNYFFYIKKINEQYNIVVLNYVYLNEYIEKSTLLVLKEDVEDLINILEDCYINDIRLKRK